MRSIHHQQLWPLATATVLLVLSCSAPPQVAAQQPSELLTLDVLVFETSESIIRRGAATVAAAASGDVSNLLALEAPGDTLREKIEALDAQNKLRLLIAPTFHSPVGEFLSAQSGTQIPVQTLNDNTVTTQYVNATMRIGLKTDSTPRGTRVEVDISRREPAPNVGEFAPAAIQTAEFDTATVLASGGTMVLYGVFDTRFGSDDRGNEVVALITVAKVP